MARANPAARKLLAAVVAPLVKAHGGAPKVAKVVGRDRTTVHRWTEGNIEWDGLAALASGTRQDIVITFPAHGRPTAQTKEPPPEWAGAMEERIVSEVVANREALYARLADEAAVRALRRAGLLPDAPPAGRPGRPPGGAGPNPTLTE